MGDGPVPIRYMVQSSMFGMKYYVLDTSMVGQGRIIARCDRHEDAVQVAIAMESMCGHPQGSYVAEEVWG